MIRLVLGVAALLCAGGALAQGPKQDLMREVGSFRTAKEGLLGDRELLQMALDEVARQQAAAAPGAAVETEPEEPDVVAESRKTLARLTTAVNLKLRMVFMRNVHDDYHPDPYLLSESLVAQFRQFPTIRFTTDFEKADVVDGDALVRFHYNLATTNVAGATNQYAGFTTVRFRMDGERAKLVAQPVTPIIFGFGLNAAENPQAVSQGPSPDRASTGPLTPAASCPTPQTGTVEMEDGNEGFVFATGAKVLGTNTADFFKVAGGLALRTMTSARMNDFGSCSLSSVHTLPASIADTNVPFAVGDCVAIRTQTSKFAVFKILALGVNAMGNPAMTFQYKYQPTGATCF